MAGSLTKVATGSGDALSQLTESLALINGMAGSDTSAAKNLLGQLKGADYSSLIQSILDQATSASSSLGAKYANASGASATGNSALQTKLSELIKSATTSAASAVSDAQLKNQAIQAQLAAILAQAKQGDQGLAQIMKLAKLGNTGSKMLTNKSLSENLKGLLAPTANPALDSLWTTAPTDISQIFSGTAAGLDSLGSVANLGLDSASSGLSASDFVSSLFTDVNSFGSADALGSLLGFSSELGAAGSLTLDPALFAGELGFGSLGMTGADIAATAGFGLSAETMAAGEAASAGIGSAAYGVPYIGPILGAMDLVSGGFVGESLAEGVKEFGQLIFEPIGKGLDDLGNLIGDIFGGLF